MHWSYNKPGSSVDISTHTLGVKYFNLLLRCLYAVLYNTVSLPRCIPDIQFLFSFLFVRVCLPELVKKPHEGFSAGLIDEDDIYKWEIFIIGPPETF